MKTKFKILRIITSINPKFGGPTATIIDTSLMLIKQGFEVDILTSDMKKNFFFKSNKIKIINKGPTIFGNYNFNLKQFLWLRKNRNKYDAFIVHGLWQFKTLMARILLKEKYFVFIHGQLDPFFAEDFFRKIKKSIYWFFFEKKNLSYSKSILLTSLGEKRTLKKTFVNTAGIKKKILKKFFTKFPMLKNKEFYLFLGRFHEKKGCEIIIESVKKIENNFKSIILFVGPMTKNIYEIKIMNLIQKYKLQKKIILSDMILDDIKWGAIQASKAMVLASHGENFGISLVESLCFGKPVLTTNKVNISDKILNFNAGYIAKDKVNSFSKILMKFERLGKNKLKKLSVNASNCFKESFDLSSDRNSLSDLLKKNLAHQPVIRSAINTN